MTIPAPYKFVENFTDESFYRVIVGRKGTYCTEYIGPGDDHGRKIQSVCPAEGAKLMDPMMLSLGIGVANLAVGLYSAYQTTKISGQLAQVTSSLKGIERTLSMQTAQLALLLEGQSIIVDKLDQMRLEIINGVATIQGLLLSQETSRRAREFQQHINKFSQYYQRCAQSVSFGEAPLDSDLHRLDEVAIDLKSWVDTELSATPLGVPERLPYVVVRAAAVLVMADIRRLSRPNDVQANRWIDDEVGLIRDEIYFLCNEVDLGCVITKRRGALYQYVVLKRTLEQRGCFNFPAGDDEVYYPADLLDFNDGLDDLAALLSKEKHSPSIKQLETLGDYQWYVQWFKLDSDSFRVDSVRHVSHEDVLNEIGIAHTDQVALDFWDSVKRIGRQENLLGDYCERILLETGKEISLPKKRITLLAEDPWRASVDGAHYVEFRLGKFPCTLEIDHDLRRVKFIENGTAAAIYNYDGSTILSRAETLTNRRSPPKSISIIKRYGDKCCVLLDYISHTSEIAAVIY